MNTYNYICNTISDNMLNNNMLQMWSKRDHNTSRFYATGFETIMFNRDPFFVLRTVLASTVAWDKEILIIGSESSREKLCRTAREQNLTYHYFDIFNDDFEEFESKISNFANISHLLVGIDSDTQIEQIPITNLLNIISRHRCSLVVYCDSSVDGINDIFGGAIDFMICGLTNEPPLSFVVARRSRLVQTEGNSDSVNFDLYSYWQWSVRERKPIIEPMTV